jgi:hypothetical protein
MKQVLIAVMIILAMCISAQANVYDTTDKDSLSQTITPAAAGDTVLTFTTDVGVRRDNGFFWNWFYCYAGNGTGADTTTATATYMEWKTSYDDVWQPCYIDTNTVDGDVRDWIKWSNVTIYDENWYSFLFYDPGTIRPIPLILENSQIRYRFHLTSDTLDVYITPLFQRDW